MRAVSTRSRWRQVEPEPIPLEAGGRPIPAPGPHPEHRQANLEGRVEHPIDDENGRIELGGIKAALQTHPLRPISTEETTARDADIAFGAQLQAMRGLEVNTGRCPREISRHRQ